MPGLEQARDLLLTLDEALWTLLLVGMSAKELSVWAVCPMALRAGTTVVTSDGDQCYHDGDQCTATYNGGYGE